ncbi:MAG: ligase-associated DNA damage response endonuclease PdeM [Pseudomonadota bacterium]
MENHAFTFCGCDLVAHASGILFWPDEKTLVVSDLHLGKSSRMARKAGVLVPPYETTDTLARLAEDITRLDPKRVICLGDSFDDLRAMDELSEDDTKRISAIMAGRDWIWIEGNHDAGPVHIGGTHLSDLTVGSLTFRHISESGDEGEVSGHYHPKALLAGRSRPSFLIDGTKIIMPAFGTYTGGLRISDPVFKGILTENALAVLTGSKTRVIPAFV